MTSLAHAVEAPALIVSGQSSQHDVSAALTSLGFAPMKVDIKAAATALTQPMSLYLIDLSANGDAIDLARSLKRRHPDALILGIADPARPAATEEAMHAGVFDVLPLPLSIRDLEARIAKVVADGRTRALADSLPKPTSYGLLGSSAAMRHVIEQVDRAAADRCGVLIWGDKGTGRERVARAVQGRNPDGPFIKVDCSGSSADDLELSLFGVASRRATSSPERRSLERIGSSSQLRKAAGGALYLRDLTELPARLQARLVRILRDREAFIDDGRTPVSLDIRFIASADSQLDMALEEGRLRQDLHDRLAAIRIEVPALRQRRDDIPILAADLLREICVAQDIQPKTLTREALTLLAALPFPGNLRDLRHLLERLAVVVPQGLIRLEDVLAHTKLDATMPSSGLDVTLRQARARFERDYIAAVLQHHRGRVPEAARVLGIQRTNLYRKMRQLNVLRAGGSNRGQ